MRDCRDYCGGPERPPDNHGACARADEERTQHHDAAGNGPSSPSGYGRRTTHLCLRERSTPRALRRT